MPRLDTSPFPSAFHSPSAAPLPLDGFGFRAVPRIFKAHIHEYGPGLTTKELVYVGAELGNVLTSSCERRPKMQTDSIFFFFNSVLLHLAGLALKVYN